MKRTVVVAVMVAIAVAGCGGSKAKTAAVSGSTPTPTESSVPSDLPSASGAVAFGAQCLKAGEALSKAAQSLSAGANADLSTQFRLVAAEMDAIKGSVPSGAVRDAVVTLSEAYASFADKVKGLNYTPSAGQAPPQAYLTAIQSFSSPKFAAAGQTLSTYFSAGCKG
jgi:hypothetical protein